MHGPPPSAATATLRVRLSLFSLLQLLLTLCRIASFDSTPTSQQHCACISLHSAPPPSPIPPHASTLRRGKFRSKPWQAVLDEARHLVDSGVVELNLIAEDTNQ